MADDGWVERKTGRHLSVALTGLRDYNMMKHAHAQSSAARHLRVCKNMRHWENHLVIGIHLILHLYNNFRCTSTYILILHLVLSIFYTMYLLGAPEWISWVGKCWHSKSNSKCVIYAWSFPCFVLAPVYCFLLQSNHRIPESSKQQSLKPRTSHLQLFHVDPSYIFLDFLIFSYAFFHGTSFRLGLGLKSQRRPVRHQWQAQSGNWLRPLQCVFSQWEHVVN